MLAGEQKKGACQARYRFFAFYPFDDEYFILRRRQDTDDLSIRGVVLTTDLLTWGF